MQPIIDIFHQFNWVDILIILLIIRFIFVSLKEGVAIEFFKLLGVFCACFLALHYFSQLASLLSFRLSGAQTTVPAFFSTITYIFLAECGYGIFVLIRLIIGRLIVAQINPVLNRWGGLVIGIARGFLTISLMLFLFLLTEISYFEKSVHYSLLGRSIVHLAPTTYQWFWKTVVSNFSSPRELNPLVERVLQFEPHTTKK